MRKVKIYLRFFWLPLLLGVVSIIGWFYMPDNFSTFKSTLFGTFLGVGLIIAQINLQNDLPRLSDDQKNDLIERAKKMRNELVDNAAKLAKYSDKLDEEIMRFLNTNGINYSEFER